MLGLSGHQDSGLRVLEAQQGQHRCAPDWAGACLQDDFGPITRVCRQSTQEGDRRAHKDRRPAVSTTSNFL
jgi:hypothetical protein